ncbi:hypothetical protein C5F50_09785 [Nitrosopumilus ureiphilus]|uniref:Uncharacterized protein n=1 Tax=Nitrosopumilus ureiphilus TaxID=1470067 RepID=A0A7D5MAZ7_9ARCH|nr:hypothetical protein C5F50_09785 [Nitrosopumilus ureiphilus]
MIALQDSVLYQQNDKKLQCNQKLPKWKILLTKIIVLVNIIILQNPNQRNTCFSLMGCDFGLIYE